MKLHPDHSWEQFTYNTTQGWLIQEDTPPSYIAASTTANTVPTDTASDESSDVVTYSYNPAVSGGGDPVNPLELVERPRETEETNEGVLVQATFMQYTGGVFGDYYYDGYYGYGYYYGPTVNTRQVSGAGITDPTWETAQDVSSSMVYGLDQSVITPAGETMVEASVNDDGSETAYTYTMRNVGGDNDELVTSEGTVTLNAFGYTTASSVTDWTSAAHPVDSTATTTDAFGRVLTSTMTQSANSSYSAVTTTSYINSDGNTNWFGPAEVDGATGSVTTATYTPAGQVATQTVNGVETDYTHDAAGELIQTKQSPGGDAADRVTQMLYDWAGRVIATKQGVFLDDGGAAAPGGETDLINRPLTYTQYDDSGQVMASYIFDGDGIGLSDFAGTDGLGLDGVTVAGSAASIDASALRAYSTAGYDAYGDTTTSTTYSVTPTSGAISSSGLVTTNVYDDQDQLIYTLAPGGLVTRTTYWGDGDVETVYTTDGAGGAPDANRSTSDSSNLTDLANDHVLNEVRSEYDDNGNLILTTNYDRLSTDSSGDTGAMDLSDASVTWSKNYYDNDNRPIVALTVGSDGSYSQTSETYIGNSDLVETSTDPLGTVTKYSYDSLDRVKQQYANYIAAEMGTATPSVNVATSTTYTAQGVTNETIVGNVTPNIVGGDYAAGTSSTVSNTYGGSTAPGGDGHWLTQTNTNGLIDTYTYDAVGDVLTDTQSDGVAADGLEHTYTYNVLGEKTSDTATLPSGSAIDNSITALTYTYNVFGNIILASSLNGSTVENQVENVYNGYGQLSAQYQEHSGAVNTSTSPEVQYVYNQSGNFSRLQELVYPNDDRVVWYNYNSGIDNTISRVSSISDGTTSSASDWSYESYVYQGISTVVGRTLTLQQSGTSTVSSIVETTMLNSFDQATNVNWQQGDTSLDQFSYTYNADGSVTASTNLSGTGPSETFSYDSLDRMTGFTESTGSPSASSWNLDSAGNRYDISGHPAQYGNSYTGSGASSASGSYTAGDLTVANVGVGTVTLKYDAWGRAVEADFTAVEALSSSTKALAYDALGRVITQTADGVVTQSYYEGSNDIEDRNAAGTMTLQYVWAGAGPNRLVLRDQPGATVTRIYALTDAAGSMTSLVGLAAGTWQVIERMSYDGNGIATVSYYYVQKYHWQYLYEGMFRLQVTLYETGGDQVYDAFNATITTPNMNSGNAYSPNTRWYDPALPYVVPAAEAGIALGVTALTWGAGAPLAFGAGGLTFAGLNSGGNRYLSGQSVGASIVGGIGDATGLSAADAFFYNRDFGTGANLNLTPAQQWAYGALAAFQLFTLGLTVAPYAGTVLRTGAVLLDQLEAGANALIPEWVGRLPQVGVGMGVGGAQGAYERMFIEEAIEKGVLNEVSSAKGGLPNNPWGSAGDPIHQATVDRLEIMAAEEFPGADIIREEPLPASTGVDRIPDVWAQDPQTLEVLKVYEAARYENNALVPRELLKQMQYEAAGIPYHFEEVR